MGSAKVSKSKPMPMDNDTSTFKSIFKKIVFFKKKGKGKDSKKENTEQKDERKYTPDEKSRKDITESRDDDQQDAVAKILDNFKKLELSNNKNEDSNVDESDNFTVKVINDHRDERIYSQSSEDSGYSENREDNCDKTDQDGSDLTLDDDKKKKKKLQTVVVPRGPTRSKVSDYAASARPYPYPESDNIRQIHQINKNTLTGGQVIVNQQCQDNFSEVDIALKHVENQSQSYQKDQEGYLEDILEYINEDTYKSSPNFKVSEDEFLNKLVQKYHWNVIEDALNSRLPEKDDINTILSYVAEEVTTSNDSYRTDYKFPTPPRSENVPSPMLESPSFYALLSPERSPVYNSDSERYQEIPTFEEEPDVAEQKPRDRQNSISSMTMKQFKDLQKEIANDFSQKECCKPNRKSCKEVFQEHLQKLKMVERKNLCFKVAKLDLKTAFRVLHHVLLSISRGSEQEDLEIALFGLVCGRILSQDAALFASDAGLSILKSAALRCPHRPLLVRYVVECVRTALKTTASLDQGETRDRAIFHEVDALGDNLVLACAREGDRCADVLAELVRATPGQPPLFRIHHFNVDGYTALHIACSQHSAGSPRLHTAHVLLHHAAADLWKGDLKGGDTALHLAVNSPNCDLHLIMLLFKHVDRKLWKSLAHRQNMSSVTPIDHARNATKSSSRQNYPQEILDFLKKCR